MRGRRARRAALNAQKSALTLWRFGSPLPPRVAENHGRYCGPTVEGLDVSDSRLGNVPRRYNAARAKSCSSFARTTRLVSARSIS
jgi:hypothetical protein